MRLVIEGVLQFMKTGVDDQQAADHQVEFPLIRPDQHQGYKKEQGSQQLHRQRRDLVPNHLRSEQAVFQQSKISAQRTVDFEMRHQAACSALFGHEQRIPVVLQETDAVHIGNIRNDHKYDQHGYCQYYLER